MIRFKRIGYSGEWELQDGEPETAQGVLGLMFPLCDRWHPLGGGKSRWTATSNDPFRVTIRGTDKDSFPYDTIVFK